MPSATRIVVGGFDVIASGTVVSYGWQPIDIYPVGQPPLYHVRLVFETEAEKPASVFINQMPGNQTLLRLINYDQAFGASTKESMHVANHLGRKLYLSFATHIIGVGATATRVTSYTFYLGETVGV